MDIFGEKWHGYVDKIRAGFAPLHEDDVTVLCGDLSWGMSLEESLEDFRFIHALPGKKILMKGNHDYWWNTVAKMQRFFDENGLDSFEILHNNCLFYGDKALCGTRGWFYELDSEGTHNGKMLAVRRGGWRHRCRRRGIGRSCASCTIRRCIRATNAPRSCGYCSATA